MGSSTRAPSVRELSSRSPGHVAEQLRRYAGAVDWALLCLPHFGGDPDCIHDNELALIEIAASWTS